jgi:hypothetical protein
MKNPPVKRKRSQGAVHYRRIRTDGSIGTCTTFGFARILLSMEAYLNLHWKCLGARASLEEFHKENTVKLEILEPPLPIQLITWAVPPRGKINVNWNAAIY